MKEARKPRMDLKTGGGAGAQPGSLFRSKNGAQGFEDSMILAGLPGKVDVIHAASRRFRGAIFCSAGACDVALLPELRQVVLISTSGKEELPCRPEISPIPSLILTGSPKGPVWEILQ